MHLGGGEALVDQHGLDLFDLLRPLARGQAGELDEVLTCIAPVMLGDGVRLFDHPGGTHIRLERIDLPEGLSHAPLATNIWFRVAGRDGQGYWAG